jgi:putative cardiolipin synthase
MRSNSITAATVCIFCCSPNRAAQFRRTYSKVSKFVAALVVTALVLGGCSLVPSSTIDKEGSVVIRSVADTPLRQISTALSAGRGSTDSGFLLLDRGNNAVAWRLFLADNATKTIDAQYFLWKNDRLGRLFLQHMLDAAERGVRVRLLIDDPMTESDPLYLAKASAHPNVEIRLYKPFGPKHNSYVFRWIDFAADFKRLNRRMHNKLYIVDDSALIVGGRNIGEDYFEYAAPDVFRSRDLLSIGPVADEASDVFDMFWNSPWTVPVEMAVDQVPTTEEAEAFHVTLDKEGKTPTNYPPGYSPIGTLAQGQARLTNELMWGPARLVFDTVPGADGTPAEPKNQEDQLLFQLEKVAALTREEIIIESAYLIFTKDTLEGINQATERGIRVLALTNSLAANNHTTAFVGYRKQRKKIIGAVSELYEYRPDAVSQTELYNELAPNQPVPHLGLHAKTGVYDRKYVFVGSFNMDPRSMNLNTETGVIVESAELGQAIANSILNDMAPGNSWLVRLNDKGKTEWVTVQDGKETVEEHSEPLTSKTRKIEADLAQPFTPESQM